MRIKKISPTTPANGNIENQYGTSQTNAYSEEYVNGQIGSLSSLTTTDKSNVVSAINELDSLKATKNVATTSANGLMSASDKSLIENFFKAKKIERSNRFLNNASVTTQLTFPAKNYKEFVITIYSRFDTVKHLRITTNSNGTAITWQNQGETIQNCSISTNDLVLTLVTDGWNSLVLEITSIKNDVNASEVSISYS
jgi:hypothetical protein